MYNRVDLYLDNTRGARFQRIEYDNAINDAMQNFIDSILNPDEAIKKKNGFQSDQYISDNLFTIQTTQTAAPTTDVALKPADYQYLTSLYATIGGTQYYCRPTTQNKLGPLRDDSFRRPSDTKPYYLQVATGFKVYHGAGTITSAELNYIRIPLTYTCGKDSQLINAGTAIVAASVYLVTEPAVHNSISYNIGDQFTAANTTLTSGQVILASSTQTCELPDKVHELICKNAASILSGVTQNYNPSRFSEKEAEKS